MISTSSMGVSDLSLRHWVIVDLKSLDKPDTFDRHMFGFCDQTGYFQLSSKIQEENDEYCQTRSRKYFKDGPMSPDLDYQAADQLIHFLHRGWGISIEDVREVLSKVSKCTISDQGYLVIHTGDYDAPV